MKIPKDILKLLSRPGVQPLDAVGICKELNIPSDQRRDVRDWLVTLEKEGKIVRTRKRFFMLPSASELVTGRILGFASGAAKLICDQPGLPEIFLSGESLGTAMHGDRVSVRIENSEPRTRDQKAAKSNKRPASKPSPQRAVGEDKSPKGRVLRILERANPTIVGTVVRDGDDHVVVPDDSRLPQRIYFRRPNPEVPRKQAWKGKVRFQADEEPPQKTAPTAQPRPGDKVVVKLDPWESRHHDPEGEIIELLGHSSDAGVDMLSVIRRYNLSVEFPTGVIEEAEKISDSIEKSDLEGREDFRAQPAITIDPDDAKDFDDAIHVEETGSGWRLSVHIADVSHYVRSGSLLDKEARKRGNSTYLVDRVLPMLPERLSNGICSLKPGVDRLAFSAFLEINERGTITGSRFARTVIRSISRLTYRQAHAILQNNIQDNPTLPRAPKNSRCHSDPEVQLRVRTAWNLAKLLRKRRFEAGSLDLDFPEVKVRLDADGKPVRIEKIENDESHQLIEECMLAANEAVAAGIKNKSQPTVYRVHESPEHERLLEFRSKAIEHGHRIGDLTQRSEVQRLLKNIRGRPEEYVLKLDFLKSLKRATYDVKPLGHYGLSKSNYTHFTSPIRRYADLLVHRSLSRSKLESMQNLSEIAVHISNTERTSAEAEKDSIQRKKMEFFERQLRIENADIFDAVVIDIRPHGLVIELPEAMLTGMVHVSALPDDRYWYDAASTSFKGRRTGLKFQPGVALRVKVARVDAHKRQVDFTPILNLKNKPEPTQSEHATTRSRHRQAKAGFRKKRR
jgi:ribonuclease R